MPKHAVAERLSGRVRPLANPGRAGSPRLRRRGTATKAGLGERLFKLVDRKTWERAQDYVGAFYETRRLGNRISGQVVGHYGAYTTALRLDVDDFVPKCSCEAASEMDCCKHAVALGLTYEKEAKAFRQTKQLSWRDVRSVDEIETFLKGATLDDLVKELKKRGVTQARLTQVLKMNGRLFASAKQLEQRGRYYGFLNACKIACAYLLVLLDHRIAVERPE